MTVPRDAGQPAAAAPGNVADAVAGNWVDRWAPAWSRPYLRLARADRPIGMWLLMWPCWWSAALAAYPLNMPYADPWHLLLFLVGAYVMRGAGCTWNDITDREFDARVARTRSRPIPSGQVTARQAALFMVVQCLIGLVVLLQFNWFTIGLGVASLAIVAVYPFMKRFTNWPQFVLGLAFGWGALVGWAAATGGLALPPLLLYGATIAWIIGYDTIYAHQDKEDDALIGLGSTALRFGPATPRWLALFYGLAWTGMFAAGWMVGARGVFAAGMTLVALQMAWQIATIRIDDPANCLQRFWSNRHLGLMVFAALTLDRALAAVTAGG